MSLNSYIDAEAHEMFEGLIKAMLVQAWGAFEAMSLRLYKGLMVSTAFKQVKGSPSFCSPESIRDTFDFALSKDPSIAAALNPCFLDPFSILSAVIVNGAGFIDYTFTVHATNWQNLCGKSMLLKDYADKPIGTRIEFGGEWAVNCVDPAVECGFRLLEAADNWLIKNS